MNGRWTSRLIFLLSLEWLAVLTASRAEADGVGLIAAGPVGPFDVAVLAEPHPLRTGRSRWDVQIWDPHDRKSRDVVEGADVEVLVRLVFRSRGSANGDQAPHPAVETTLPLSAGRTTDRALYSGWIELDSPGHWRAEVHARDRDRDLSALTFDVVVERESPPIARHYVAFALPFFALAFFALHQWLLLRSGGMPQRGSSQRGRPSSPPYPTIDRLAREAGTLDELMRRLRAFWDA